MERILMVKPWSTKYLFTKILATADPRVSISVEPGISGSSDSLSEGTVNRVLQLIHMSSSNLVNMSLQDLSIPDSDYVGNWTRGTHNNSSTLALTSGKRRSKVDISSLAMSNSTGDTPVVECGVIR
ncbi:hypothetical protein ROHU_000556 [Labeo rohita]|uniref:Uncharacterized protein n=1 Tax=Labeo rohita TaxID=84645 RepID=A0A498P5T7_LABRO|nr:hypothetical protein ROHU_027133 [Labeo rohita]RXN39049.1 hypothetical protein ROHU_000556 [Labeo rohita]